MPLEFSRFLLNHITLLNPSYPLFSAIMVTLVEKSEKQDSMIKTVLLPVVNPTLSQS